MLNKKKVAIVVLISIIIILAIIVLVNSNNRKSKVFNLYSKLEKSNEYLFEMKDTSNYEISIAKKNGQTSIDMNNEGERITTLVKEDEAYLISHSVKEYYIYDSSIAGETIVTDMLKDLQKADKKGTEKINGKNYKYEEYDEFAGFITSTNINIEEKNVKTRFYFEGKKLMYIKTLPEEGEEELLQINISYQVPDELFEIPSDYAEVDYDSQGTSETMEKEQEGEE